MTTMKNSRKQWNSVRSKLSTHSLGTRATIERGGISHPRDAGARPTTSWPADQVADFAFDGPAGQAPLVVREHEDHFEAFIDGSYLATQFLNTVQARPEAAMYLGGAVLGGAIGASLSNKRDGVLLGAGVGLLFAALLNAALDDE
jgi:hypothetical protein